MFKIKNPEGLFSSGGMRPSFTATGKTFAKRGHITSHLAQLNSQQKRQFYEGCTVVEYKMVEVGPVQDVLDWQPAESTIRAKELDKERRIKQEREYLKSREAQLEAELARIRKKTGTA